MTIINVPKPAWQLKVYRIFTILGWILILLSFILGAFVLSSTAASYYGDHAKSTRDAANVGSALLSDLGTLASTPRWLEPLTFLGVASFMLGIALEFSSIPALLKNRGQLLKKCFPLIAKSGG